MMSEIKLYRRPSQEVIDEIVELIQTLLGEWFTDNIPEDTRRDLLFQDLICLYVNGRIKSFLVFTSWEGSIYITLMGTQADERGRGLGSQLIEYLIEHIKALGFKQIVLLTVPPDVKSNYGKTIKFYEKHGFQINKRYSEIWNSGAIEMTRNL